MKRILLAVFSLWCAAAAAEPLPADILGKLQSYNVVYDHVSTIGSAGNMPLGNGDITVNAWTEGTGDLLLYIGKSDSWSEAGRLLKIGRVRMNFNPNPFVEGAAFSQTLNLADGCVDIVSRSSAGNVKIKVWADACAPVVRIDVSSSRKLEVTVSDDGMRAEKTFMRGRGADSFHGLGGAPYPVYEDPDMVLEAPGKVVWAHHNTRSFYADALQRQNVGPLADKYEDPYMDRTFGAAMGGKNFVKVSPTTLRSARGGTSFHLDIAVLTEKADVGKWQKDVEALLEPKADWKAHQRWWREFWNRSWIFVEGDEDAVNVTRAWLLQRFMMACQGRGAWPVKFNGGSLTFDYDGYDADYRRWGPGYWHQNERLLYWPLLASGDDDLLRPWFDFYMRLLPFQRDVTRMQFGHGGAYFPETMNPFGLYVPSDWGWDNPGKASDTRWIRYHWSGGLEVLSMMLDEWDYTQDEDFARDYVIPFATEVLRFFACHWPKVNHTLRFIPANSIEQFWDCLNPTDYIAGIMYDVTRLRAVPGVTEDLQKEWEELLAALPPLPVSDGRILPAEEFGKGRNLENPELYAVFPFRLYGRGSDLALNTYKARVFNNSNSCWSQDNIQAALMGLSADAARFCVKKATSGDSKVYFPAFWKVGSDWIPDFDNGGSMAAGLQYMLLSPEGEVKPACPENWKVDFKLRCAGGTTVRYRD